MAALAAVLLGTLAAYWLNPPVRLPDLEGEGAGPGPSDGLPRVRGLTYTHVENGVKKWTLSAERARYDEKAQTAILYQVRVKFFPARGGWIVLTGEEGSYDRKAKRITLRGNVRGRSSDGLTLQSDELTYAEDRQMVKSRTPVTVSGPRFRVRGQGMELWVPQQVVVFKGQVESTFVPQGQGPPPGATAE